jgi:hypothetical protein
VRAFSERTQVGREAMVYKMDETYGEDLKERVNDLEAKQEESVESFRICSLMRGRWISLP